MKETNSIKSFRQSLLAKAREQHALGTLEIVVIIAVLLAVAFIFKDKLTSFAQSLMDKVFNESVISGL